jgi:hypothetical protein
MEKVSFIHEIQAINRKTPYHFERSEKSLIVWLIGSCAGSRSMCQYYNAA